MNPTGPQSEDTPISDRAATAAVMEAEKAHDVRVEVGRPVSEQHAKPRYVFIDGLRGIASLLVLAHHFYNGAPAAIHETYAQMLPSPLAFLFGYGWFGVEIFFVISGFVIAHSVGNSAVTPGYFANFAVRRSIRIDPPYWVALVSYVLIRQAGRVFIAHQPSDFPSIQCWLANLFYLQIWYGEMLLAVSWSLCHELQFYVLFVGLMGIYQYFVGIDSPTTWRSSTLLVLLFGVTGIASAAYPFEAERYAMVTCAETWHLFCCGVMCYFLLNRKIPQVVGWAYLICVTYLQHDRTPYAPMLACVWISVLAACYSGKLTVWLGSRIFQYFGRISYSLYLVHMIVGTLFLSYAYKAGVKTQIPLAACVIFATAISVGTAHLMYVFVEKPTVQLSKRFKSFNFNTLWRRSGNPTA